MRTGDKNLVIGAMILFLVIGILAPFIASSNPDGLEKSAELLMNNSNTSPVIHAPMSDYNIPGLGKLGEIGAMILGIIMTLLIAYLVAMLFKKRTSLEASTKLDFLRRIKL